MLDAAELSFIGFDDEAIALAIDAKFEKDYAPAVRREIEDIEDMENAIWQASDDPFPTLDETKERLRREAIRSAPVDLKLV